MSRAWWFDDDDADGDRGELWTTHEAAVALGVPHGTIRSWASRGKLKPAERRDRTGRAQYWERDLRRLAQRASLPTR